LVVCFFALARAFTEIEYTGAFSEWLTFHDKMYTAEEFQNRYIIFKDNMDFVASWNAAGDSETVLGLNKFADMTNDEYRNTLLGFKPKGKPAVLEPSSPVVGKIHIGLPLSVDWRLNGSVTPVKDQGQCGGCWAFSAVGSVEAAHYKAKGNLVSLSEQNLIDCSDAEGNKGCGGGEMDDAFKYIIKNNGIDTESSYPYHAKNEKCAFSAANVGATISAYKDVLKDSETELTNAIATVGPVSVAIDASHKSFQLYTSGVYYEKKCSSKKLDHGVLAVGYAVDKAGLDYYIVKNSWGADWGQSGYIWMSRNKNNNCGIATSASYPIA